MISLLVCAFVILAIILFVEFLRSKKLCSVEYTRKFVHITVGVFAAFWPTFLSRDQIVLMGLAMLCVVYISKKHNVFKSIHKVKRKTNGEYYFALAIIGTAIFANTDIVYSVAVLHMSLADGFAAIVGTSIKKGVKYRVAGQRKSAEGSFTFFCLSLFLIVIFADITQSSRLLVFAVPATATIIENISPHGSDDLFVPVSVVFLLQAFS